MGTLFQAFEDLLSFGEIVIIVMLVAGFLAVVTMLAESLWLVRVGYSEIHEHNLEKEQASLLAAKLKSAEPGHGFRKSA